MVFKLRAGNELTFFIDWATMTILNRQKGHHNYVKLGWDNSTLMDISNNREREITITAIKLSFELRSIYMQLL